MNLKDKPIREVLSMAKSLYQEENYPDALTCLEYFFEHSLDDDPAALYGVRLSYCLNSWAMLAHKYLPAMESLRKQKEIAINRFEETAKSIHFSEFQSIAEYLNESDIVLPKFLNYHAHKPELARRCVHLVWEELIKKKMWEVCAAYPKYIGSIYEKALFILDECSKMHASEPQLFDSAFFEDEKKRFVEKVNNLLLIFKNTNQKEKIKPLTEQVSTDMHKRGYPELTDRIISA